MHVLLAGSTGAIGPRLVRRLRDAGHEVTGLARSRAQLNVNLLDRSAALAAVDGLEFDAIIHQATAMALGPVTHSQMIRTNRLRSEGTSTLLAIARATGAKKFVTASVFLGYGFIDHGMTPLTEDDAFGFRTGSASDEVHAALLSNEQQVLAFGGTVLRYGLFYGDHGGAVATANDFNGVLPLIHLEDAAAAAVVAVERGKNAAYNIADDHPVSWREFQEARAISEGRRFPVALPSWALRAAAPFGAELLTRTSMRLSTAKARRELRWKPQYPSFAEGLALNMEIEHQSA